MDIATLCNLPLSADRGWPELAKHRPDLGRLFLTVVLPLSLLPPAMLYFAGTHHPEMFTAETSRKPWSEVAIVFFLAELATFVAMGWFIRQVAASSKLALDYRDAYLLAAVTPVPMWLSSLGLLADDLLGAVVIALIGLALSCGIIYHGILALARIRESVVAGLVVQIVIGAGLIAWSFLLVLAIA